MGSKNRNRNAKFTKKYSEEDNGKAAKKSDDEKDADNVPLEIVSEDAIGDGPVMKLKFMCWVTVDHAKIMTVESYLAFLTILNTDPYNPKKEEPAEEPAEEQPFVMPPPERVDEMTEEAVFENLYKGIQHVPPEVRPTLLPLALADKRNLVFPYCRLLVQLLLTEMVPREKTKVVCINLENGKKCEKCRGLLEKMHLLKKKSADKKGSKDKAQGKAKSTKSDTVDRESN
ncbi:hypothetical protein KR018_000412 [Drosophila ironensis]|nr:hypothetical protein KR018_000412 [Drosophila ironensis]